MMKASILLTSVAALALVLTACTPGDTTEPESVSAEQPDTNVGEEQPRDYSQGDLEVLNTPAVAGASTFIRAVSDLGGVEFLFDLDGNGEYETESDSDGLLHTFDEAGEYPVSVKVTYEDGRVRTGSTVVVVTEPSNISIDFSPPTEENGRILTDYTAKQNSDGSISVVINGLGQGEAFGIRFIAADTPDDKTFMSPPTGSSDIYYPDANGRGEAEIPLPSNLEPGSSKAIIITFINRGVDTGIVVNK